MTAPPPDTDDAMAAAARKASERARGGALIPEPSLGARRGPIGILGWMIVAPTLFGVLVGRWLDRALGSGVFFSAPLIMIGAALGFRAAWKWMHRP